MKFRLLVTLTWSKIMAFLIVGLAFGLDLKNGGATCFMFSIPFASALIFGKQVIDSKKPQGTNELG